jgi:hypothetical protein
MINFTPKKVFTEGPSAAAWTDIAASKVFFESASAAMLQLQFNLGVAENSNVASSNHYKMEGARAFLGILINLTTPPEEQRRPEMTLPENLDHKI